MVKIVIGNITSNIVGHLPPEVHEDLHKNLSYKVANARHMPKVKSGQWDGVIRLYWKHKGQSFYTGLMAFVREVLKFHNILMANGMGLSGPFMGAPTLDMRRCAARLDSPLNPIPIYAAQRRISIIIYKNG